MPDRSKRELRRALENMREDAGADYDGPDEIIITDHVVDTDHPTESTAPVRKTRVWRDDTGEWHTEELDAEEDSET